MSKSQVDEEICMRRELVIVGVSRNANCSIKEELNERIASARVRCSMASQVTTIK